jgi:hypothetical protein
MKNYGIIFSLFLYLFLFGIKSASYAQSSPVMYFCERYDSKLGEVGISDRFTVGYLTIMVKCDKPMNLNNVFIEFDKYNTKDNKFEFYKKFNYIISPDQSYVFFTRNEENDLRFEEPGIYRVFLLNDQEETVTSAMIEIVSGASSK